MNREYNEYRKDIEAVFKSYCSDPAEREEIVSPSGNFLLTVDTYSQGSNSWEYSRGRVRRHGDDKVIADVKRNFGTFFHTWSQHSNGNEYLICGEDYQGQTVVNLTKGETYNYFPDSGYEGHGFCWVAAWPSPDSTILAVEGCYWACPYEVVFFDFREPELLPYKELLRVDELDYCEGWLGTNHFRMTQEIQVRKKDNHPYQELPESEQDEIDEDADLGCYVKREVLVTREQIFRDTD